MENGVDPRIAHIARQTLGTGRQILVVGVNPGELGEWHHINDPRIVVWSSTDYKHSVRVVPKGVALVVVTRFVSHGTVRRIKRNMPSDAVMYARPFNQGELKTFLKEVYTPLPPKVASDPMVSTSSARSTSVPIGAIRIPVSTPAKTEIVPLPLPQEVKMEKPQRGQAIAFIRANANLSAPKPGEEIRRLVALAAQNGLALNEATTSNAFFMLKKKDGKPVGLAPAASTTPAAKTAKGARRDAVKVLEEFVEHIDLVLVAVHEIVEENRRMQGENDALKAEIKGKKKAIKDALAQLV